MEQALERWAGDYSVRSRHCRTAGTDPETLWRAAQTVTLADTRTLGRLVRWRIPGTPADLTYQELFTRYPFTALDQGPTWTISGLAGKIWTLSRDYPRLSGPEEYEAWSEPGTVKVLFGHWTRPAEGGGSELISDCRIEPVDRRAALRVKGLWAVVGTAERLIGSEPLVIAQRRAEQGG